MLLRVIRLAVLLLPLGAQGQLELVPDKSPHLVFGGEGRSITVLLHNSGVSAVEADLHTSLYQASSATAIPLGVTPWKKLQVLPGQTVHDSALITFPAVKAETHFVVKWLDGTNKVFGTTEVLVYPADLLKALKPLAGEEPLGVLDPQNLLKPLLKAATVERQDLADTELGDYRGKLAICGPYQSQAQMQEGLPNRVKALARKGVAVVWIQPPPGKRQELKPSFYTVPEGKGTVVVVQADLVANLAESPKAQLNLIHFARLALHPEPLQLPNLTQSP